MHKSFEGNATTLSTILKRSLLFTILAFCSLSLQAQSKTAANLNDTLIVGVVGSEPFVFNDHEDGIAPEIWEKIATDRSWNYKYVPYDNVENALHDLDKGRMDVVIGPISITSKRLEYIRFSQPFYNSSISILSRMDTPTLWQKIKPLFSLKLLMAVIFFLVILGIVGTFLWLAERKRSPEQFPYKPLPGIGNGMWLAIVTMSTTGYGDKAPITLLGRIIAGSWMVISIIFATSMVAGIASTLTISSLGSTTISNVEQLSKLKAATILGSPSDEFMRKSKTEIIGVSDLDEAFKKLKDKDVDAVVYDRPQLLYHMKNSNDKNLYLSKAEYSKQGYGFAFPINSELVSDVNRALLELSENQDVERIIHYYIDVDE